MLALLIATCVFLTMALRRVGQLLEDVKAAHTAADTMATGLARRATGDELDQAERVASAWRQARDGALV